MNRKCCKKMYISLKWRNFKQLSVIFAKNSRFICLKAEVHINNLVKPCGLYIGEYYKLKVRKI